MFKIGLKSGLAIVVLLLGMDAPSAIADVTATFTDNDRQRTVIEVASNGSGRITQDNGARIDQGYSLIRDGKVYRVSPGPGGPVAVSAEAAAYDFRQSVMRGETILGKSGHQQSSWVAKGTARVAGYDGTRYQRANGVGPSLVVTDDPRFEPLGVALDRYLSQTDAEGPESGLDPFRSLIATHGVLSFFGQDLAQVSFSPIDPKRFALPAKVVELVDVKQPEGEATTLKSNVHVPQIVKGTYYDGALYLLDNIGAVQVWAEGSDHGKSVKTPGPVRYFCFSGPQLWAVTMDKATKQASLWSRQMAAEQEADAWEWSKIGAFPISENSWIIALDCSGIEPIVVFFDHLTMPLSGKSVPLKGGAPMGPGYIVSQVQGGMLWLGFNSGEWGGGLRRIRLADGMMDAPSSTDPKTLCGGTLNPECDPVTGLAPDTSRPDCMLAAVGLVHMMSHGGVVRICGNDVSLAYAKPYTLDPNWHWDGKLDRDKESSLAFYSMAANRGDDKAFAVAADGVYSFSHTPVPDFKPFSMQQAKAVDWSHPDYVLVATRMNQRHSLSGASIILIPR